MVGFQDDSASFIHLFIQSFINSLIYQYLQTIHLTAKLAYNKTTNNK